MYYGKMTEELEQLYDAYYEKFHRRVGGYMELEYGQEDYNKYVEDIKISLNLNKSLPKVVMDRIKENNKDTFFII